MKIKAIQSYKVKQFGCSEYTENLSTLPLSDEKEKKEYFRYTDKIIYLLSSLQFLA